MTDALDRPKPEQPEGAAPGRLMAILERIKWPVATLGAAGAVAAAGAAANVG